MCSIGFELFAVMMNSHFISAGQDGMMLVWKLSGILASSTGSNKQESIPLYSFSDHTLPITDVFVGKGGMRALAASVSLDRTCRIYDLASGTLLLNLVFPDALTAITIDHLDTKVYIGTFDGNIFEFSLQSPPRTREYHLNHETLASKQRFVGHKGAITALSVSLDGETLLSGGNDENAHFWHIPSKQIIRTLPHKGSITNAKFVIAPKAMFDQEKKLHLIANSFKRMIDNQAMHAKNFAVYFVQRSKWIIWFIRISLLHLLIGTHLTVEDWHSLDSTLKEQIKPVV